MREKIVTIFVLYLASSTMQMHPVNFCWTEVCEIDVVESLGGNLYANQSAFLNI